MDDGSRRREDDRRLDRVEKKVDTIGERVDELRDWLMSEPESSALGRQLLARAKANRVDIDKHDARLGAIERLAANVVADRKRFEDHDDAIDSLELWRAEWRGSWRFITAVGTILGIIGAFFGLASWFGWHGAVP